MRFLRAAGSRAAIPKCAIAMPLPPVRAPGLARRPPAESNHPDPRAQKTRGGRNRSGVPECWRTTRALKAPARQARAAA